MVNLKIFKLFSPEKNQYKKIFLIFSSISSLFIITFSDLAISSELKNNSEKNLNQRMINSNSDIGTLASKITEKKKYQDTNIVKVTTEKSLDESFFPSAVNFSRKSNQII